MILPPNCLVIDHYFIPCHPRFQLPFLPFSSLSSPSSFFPSFSYPPQVQVATSTLRETVVPTFVASLLYFPASAPYTHAELSRMLKRAGINARQLGALRAIAASYEQNGMLGRMAC